MRRAFTIGRPQIIYGLLFIFLAFYAHMIMTENAIMTGNRQPVPLQWIQQWRYLSPDRYSHAQGVAIDGEYLYLSGSTWILKTDLGNPNPDQPLAFNNFANSDGTRTDQINGIKVKDGILYASAPIFLDSQTSRFFVKLYDLDTLAFVGEMELKWDGVGETQESIVYYGGYWWSCYFDQPVISRYDEDFNYIDSIELPEPKIYIQGINWREGQLWVAHTGGSVNVYDWLPGSREFRLVIQYQKAPQQKTLQGFEFLPDNENIYWADFEGSYNYLYKIGIPES